MPPRFAKGKQEGIEDLRQCSLRIGQCRVSAPNRIGPSGIVVKSGNDVHVELRNLIPEGRDVELGRRITRLQHSGGDPDLCPQPILVDGVQI